MSLSSRPEKERGFTLLEVLIAMAILVFIAMGIYQATVETYRLRDVLSNEGDFYNRIRLSMEMIQRDYAALYSPQMMVPGPTPSPSVDSSADSRYRGGNPYGSPNDPDLQNILSGDLGQLSQFWLPATDKTGIRASRFVGTDSKMSFISLSHLRIYKDSKESEFAKVTYEFRKDTDDKTSDTLALVKTENPDAFDTDEAREKEKSRTLPLLSGITKFQIKYLRRDGEQWTEFNNWDSSDAQTFRNSYPDIIVLNLSVSGPSRLSFEGTYKFRPEVPLNGINPSH